MGRLKPEKGRTQELCDILETFPRLLECKHLQPGTLGFFGTDDDYFGMYVASYPVTWSDGRKLRGIVFMDFGSAGLITLEIDPEYKVTIVHEPIILTDHVSIDGTALGADQGKGS